MAVMINWLGRSGSESREVTASEAAAMPEDVARNVYCIVAYGGGGYHATSRAVGSATLGYTPAELAEHVAYAERVAAEMEAD